MKPKVYAKLSVCISALLLFCSGSVCASNTDGAVYAYSEDDRTLTVTIGANATNTFDFAAYGTYLTGNSVTNFIKNGEGALIFESDIGAYLGDITVESGTYTFTTNRALGKLAGENVCGSVYVKNGATLDSRPATDTAAAIWGWFNKRICFEGSGVNGIGALIHTGKFVINRMVFSSNLVMTADAKIANHSSATMYMSGGSTPVWLDMNGHTLTCEGNKQIAWGCLNVKNPGKIISYLPQFTLQNNYTHLNGASDNELIIKNNQNFTLNGVAGSSIDWTLDARELGGLTVSGGVGELYNIWSGPVLLGDGNLRAGLTYGNRLSLSGPISGNGGFYVESYNTNSPGRFNLGSSDNSFAGGVALSKSSLGLWNNGALPLNGGELSMTNSSVFLTNLQDVYSLPELKVVGNGRVVGGEGSWKSVKMIGSNKSECELEWWSGTASDTLDVTSGTVWFRKTRKHIAGLIESERTYYASKAETDKCWDTVFTNIVTLSPAAYYDKNHHLWTERVPDGSKPRFMLAYTGYIWNNETTNVTWSFAGGAGTHLHVRVDGTNSFRYIGNWEAKNTYMFTMKDVTPGSHKIDIRGYHIDNLGEEPPKANFPSEMYSSSTPSGQKLKWPETNFAVGFDPKGRGSLNQKDYIKLIDPGDGSLLTWALPEDVKSGETIIPGTDEKIICGAPEFGKITFAAGTGMKSDYDVVTIPELEGLPSVTGVKDRLIVTDKWIVPVEHFMNSSILSTEGRLSVSSGATIEILDENRAGRNSGEAVFAVATADGGIDLPSDVLMSGATREWKLFVSSDGKTLNARHTPIGTIISLR